MPPSSNMHKLNLTSLRSVELLTNLKPQRQIQLKYQEPHQLKAHLRPIQALYLWFLMFSQNSATMECRGFHVSFQRKKVWESRLLNLVQSPSYYHNSYRPQNYPNFGLFHIHLYFREPISIHASALLSFFTTTP